MPRQGSLTKCNFKDMIGKEKERLLAEVATLYYYDGLTQEKIAQKLGLSRSTVSRMLNEARRRGIVEIHINYLWETDQSLQNSLTERFGLGTARVLRVETEDYKRILHGLGALAARYIEGILRENSVLAIGWGTAVHQVVEAFRPMRIPGIQVVQMIGAVGSGDPFIDGPELARILAQKLGGKWHYLHAPLIVEEEALQKALIAEPRLKKTLELATKADVAIVGIGSVEPSISSLIRAGYITLEELAAIRARGAVGDVCARHFDIHGRILDIDINRRIIGITPEQLKKIRCVVGVAGGKAKAPAILGALRGGFIDVLVTDCETAKEVLRLDKET